MPNPPARRQNALTTPAQSARAEVYLEWLSNFDSQHTRAAYRKAVEGFWQDMGVGLWEARSSHFVAWKGKLQDRYSPASVNLKLSALSSFYAYVVEQHPDLMAENPVDAAKRKAVNPYGKSTYLREQQDYALLTSIDRGTLEGARDFAIIYLALTTALRLDAVARARVGDAINQGGIMFLEYVNKGGATERKRLPGNAWANMIEYLKWRDVWDESAYLFDIGGANLASRRRAIQRMIRRRCDAVFGEGHGITFHSLRHTAAMNAIQGGATALEVSSLLKHKDLRVTTIYLQHIDDSAGDKASNILDERYSD